jgi:hypothetical protein
MRTWRETLPVTFSPGTQLEMSCSKAGSSKQPTSRPSRPPHFPHPSFLPSAPRETLQHQLLVQEYERSHVSLDARGPRGDLSAHQLLPQI